MINSISKQKSTAVRIYASANRFGWFLPAFLYIGLVTLYLFAIPVGESPDEPGHLQCIEQVALHNRIPVQEPNPHGIAWWSREKVTSGYMCYHMPFYYLTMGLWVKGAAAITTTAVPFEFPPGDPDFEKTDNVFLHDNKPTLWTLSEPITLIGIRLASILMGGVVVWGSYYVARQLQPGRPLIPVLAAVLVAGWPQFLFLSRAINNDSLATALAVAVLIFLSKIGQPRRFYMVAILSALAMFTKVSVAFVLIVSGIIWLLEWRLYPKQRSNYVHVGIICALVLTAVFALIWLQPTLNLHFFSSARSFSAITEQAKTIAYWQEVLRLTSSSGWARLGWMNVPAPALHGHIWWLFLLATAVAGYLYLLRHVKTVETKILLLLAAIWLTAALFSYFRINLNRFQPQFRFLLTTIPILTALAATGCLFGLKTQAKQWLFICSVTSGMIIYNLWLVFSLIRPVYGWTVS